MNGTGQRPEEPADDPLLAGLAAAYGPRPDPPSVLESLRARSGVEPRVALRDTNAPDAAPVLKALDEEPRQLPRQVGRCRLLGEIARGGIGLVLKGHDADLGREVAVKLLHERYLLDPAALHRFVEEAQIGGQLQHPGIVPVYDLGLQNGWPYFTMKLIRGRTVAALLAERMQSTTDLRRLLFVFEQVCHTVAYAHARGVIHRDLKPGNVMVGAFGEVQVVDWGMAKVLGHGGRGEGEIKSDVGEPVGSLATVRSQVPGRHTEAGSILGTAAYMPPEQARGEVETMDERSDVFALGAILCEILTGKPPYAGTGHEALAHAASCRTQAALERLAGCGADTELVTLVMECLQGAPEARPRHAGVLAERVAGHLSAVEERARLASLAAAEARVRAASARRMQRLTVGLAASIVATVVAVGGGLWWNASEASARRTKSGRSVQEALLQAERLRGQAEAAGIVALVPWRDALAAAHRARVLVEVTEVDADLRAQVLLFSDRLQHEHDAAQAQARQRERDAAMVARLEEIPIEAEEGWWVEGAKERDYLRQGEAYRSAFREHGIDVTELAEADAAARLTASAIATELAGALDWWGLTRKLGCNDPVDPLWPRLLRLALAADPDPWRGRLRRTVLALGPAGAPVPALEELAGQADVASLSPLTIRVLGQALDTHGLQAPAAALYRRAVVLHPGDYHINCLLAHWVRGPDPAAELEAVRFFQAALAIRPGSGMTRLLFGDALDGAGRTDEGIDAYRLAIRQHPDFALGHYNLGGILLRLGRLPEAIAAFGEAVRLRPDSALAHGNLGVALSREGRQPEAIAAFREAIRLQPGFGMAHYNLGIALRAQGKLEEAMASYRDAIRVAPDDPKGHYNLGIGLGDQGRLDEAIVAYRNAIRLNPDYAEAHCNLGNALVDRRRSAEGLEALERGHALGSARAGWQYPTTDWVKRARTAAALEARLLPVLEGRVEASNTREALDAAGLGFHRQRYAAAARLCAAAFPDRPEALDNVRRGYWRYDAACTCALAGCGKGEDRAAADAETRAAWRARALAWLRADLEGVTRRFAAAEDAWNAAPWLPDSLVNPAFAPVRDDPSLEQIAEPERTQWRALWRELRQALESGGRR